MISLTTYDHKKAAHLQQIINIHYINTFRNARHKNNIKDPNLIALSKYDNCTSFFAKVFTGHRPLARSDSALTFQRQNVMPF